MSSEPDAPVSIPALLARNASRLGGKPAYREKEYGIWQSWTWAETEAEVLALAAGLAGLGLGPGDHLAVIGRNRPSLYWAMVATHCCGAIPVPQPIISILRFTLRGIPSPPSGEPNIH